MSSDVKGVTGSPVQHREFNTRADQPASTRVPDAGARPSAGQDTVVLTDTAAKLQQLEKALASVPITDAKKVEEMRQTIEEGRYQVNPGRVADKLAQFEQLLGNTERATDP